ncbi:MAG TPA: hypothetical protein VHK27_13905, partial [Gammaproteobacteria bacterium]|nr:hypothetical protein [Gammaproteobacteria bacterium]
FVASLGALLACRMVGEIEQTRAEGHRIYEFQSLPIAPVLEETLRERSAPGRSRSPRTRLSTTPSSRPPAN